MDMDTSWLFCVQNHHHDKAPCFGSAGSSEPRWSTEVGDLLRSLAWFLAVIHSYTPNTKERAANLIEQDRQFNQMPSWSKQFWKMQNTTHYLITSSISCGERMTEVYSMATVASEHFKPVPKMQLAEEAPVSFSSPGFSCREKSWAAPARLYVKCFALMMVWKHWLGRAKPMLCWLFLTRKWSFSRYVLQ